MVEKNNNGKERILIVEDDSIYRELLSTILDNAGYEVTKAASAAEAWEILNKDRSSFEVIVTDKIMPSIGGIELFHQLKSSERFKKIPVIMQTAASRKEEIIEGINAGMFYYLVKPYEQEMLLSVVRAALKEHRQQKKFDDLLLKNKLALGSFNFGEFSFRTIEEAQNISSFLASLFPNPEAAQTGLYELMVNAVEHGNLGIKYDLKTELIATNNWEKELQSRLVESDKEAKLYFENDRKKITVSISDQGQGFDWQPFMKIEPARATNNHGRGIAKANLLSFDDMKYEGVGNKVICTVYLKKEDKKVRAA